MLSPTPLSLFCALLLSLPLAIVFTVTTTTINTNDASAVTNSISTDTHEILVPKTHTNQNNESITAIINIKPLGSPPPPKEDDGEMLPNASRVDANRTNTTAGGTVTRSISLDTHETQVAKTDTNPNNQTITVNIKIKPLGSPPPPPPKADDEEILQLASRVDPTPRLPGKLAFLFLTTTPLHFAPLWELYFNQTPKALFSVYVHADPNANYNPPFTGVFAHRVIPSKPSKRQTSTLSSAARRLLAHALLDDPSNAMFALLSPSCIPIHSFNFTYGTLMNSTKSFIEILKNEKNARGRWAARGEMAMLPEVTLEEFRIGSQFWVLTRMHARIVVGDKKLWPKFDKPCLDRRNCFPEENYFPTLISMADPQGSVPATLTHIDWRGRRDGHPRVYNASEVDSGLIMSLRKERPKYGDDVTNGSDSSVTRRSHDPFLFARKFSPNSLLPLLSIANVIFKD